VAECYLESGIIKKDFTAGNYLPKDFSSDPHAQLQDVWAQDGDKNKYELLPEFKIVRKLSPGYKYDPDKTEEEEEAEAAQRVASGQTEVTDPSAVHVGERHDRNTFVT